MLLRTSAVALGFLTPCLLLTNFMTIAAAQNQKDFAIVIHGGAGGDPNNWAADFREQRRQALRNALERGIDLLKSGKSAMDVVEQVVRVMEDDEVFNAGRGCVLNENGEHELDASIMDGSNLACGGVAGVRRVKHPITAARRVLSETRHVLLIGRGADEFAEAMQLELADDDYFRTPRQLENWQRWKSKEADVTLYRPQAHPKHPANDQTSDDQLYLGTVGCVALDKHGNLAAATSTGGLMGKRWGRVGDTPIIGAGNYADNASCAVSGTGVGEEFIRRNVAADISARMRYHGDSLQQAAADAVAQLPPDTGGVIAVDRLGNLVMEFNTPGMSRGFADSSGQQGIMLSREE